MVVTALVADALAQTVLVALKMTLPPLRLLEAVVAKWAVAAVDCASIVVHCKLIAAAAFEFAPMEVHCMPIVVPSLVEFLVALVKQFDAMGQILYP